MNSSVSSQNVAFKYLVCLFILKYLIDLIQVPFVAVCIEVIHQVTINE